MVHGVKYMLADGAKAPFRKYSGDAGWDLSVTHPAVVQPGQTVDVHTGVYIDMPPGLGARITGRSSTLRNRGLIVNEGIIDQGYNGELFVCVHNVGSEPYNVKVGDRLAQLLFFAIPQVTWENVGFIQLQMGERNGDGFGSTGE